MWFTYNRLMYDAYLAIEFTRLWRNFVPNPMF